ncbi:type II toxin-antitoxin system RelE/ParE family toxin [Prevotella pectinovora]|uniref:Toxin RelE n=2 Tax=Prevotella pectinovora TaxID=1602169 RepID=A0A0D0I6I2_9BACT|nr:type II toxin-antitoxin system RelE/ParE family toxin [Prevotella pectinovora]KIP63028.1 toxin RelE [Prevotella pectinovora]
MSEYKLRVVLMDEALTFVRSLPLKVQQKITYNFKKTELGVMDKELFKKLENSEIWEFRTLFNGNCYRLFSFWDTETETLVIATHGIIKKSQKTPPKEITKAEEIRKKYFELKHQ